MWFGSTLFGIESTVQKVFMLSKLLSSTPTPPDQIQLHPGCELASFGQAINGQCVRGLGNSAWGDPWRCNDEFLEAVLSYHRL